MRVSGFSLSLRKKLIGGITITLFTGLIASGIISFLVARGIAENSIASEIRQVQIGVENLIRTSYEFTQDKVNTNMKVAGVMVENRLRVDPAKTRTLSVTNQVTSETKSVTLPTLLIDSTPALDTYALVDEMTSYIGGVVTIFQLIPDGLLRVSTSVKKKDGNRATSTFIPKESPVYQSVTAGKNYMGRAFVVNDWYIAAYKPLRDSTNRIIGALFVGIDQANIDILKEKILPIKIGKKGFVQIFDTEGRQVVHPDAALIGTIRKTPQHEKMIEMKNGEVLEKQASTANGEKGENVHFLFSYFKEMEWIISISIYDKEMYAPLSKLQNSLLVVFIFFTLLSGVIAFLISRGILRNLFFITSALKDISEGRGDLTKNIAVRTRDEIGKLSEYFNSFVDSLHGIIIELKAVGGKSRTLSHELSSNATEIASSVRQIAATIGSIQKNEEHLTSRLMETDGSVEEIGKHVSSVNFNIDLQAASVAESSAAIEEMLASVGSLSRIAEEKKTVSDRLAAQALAGSESIAKTFGSMQEIEKFASVIMEMIGIINDVSARTNLLAMNAAIEAAHAGSSGRGFAVVASEIRKLAEATASNSRNISATIEKISDQIRTTGESTRTTKEFLGEIILGIRDVTSAMGEMIQGLKEIASGSNQMTANLGRLTSSTRQVQDSSQEMGGRIERIREGTSAIRGLAQENLTAIQEIGLGISEISRSTSVLAELGLNNNENISLLEEHVNKFKTA